MEAGVVSERSDGRLRCSLAESVDRLQDDVAKLVIWDVDVDYDVTDGKMETLTLSNANESARSRMTKLDIYFEFWGIYNPVELPDEEIGRIPFTEVSETSVITFDTTLNPGKYRPVETIEIGRIGRALVEKYVASKAKERGSVQFVKIYITPYFGDEKGVMTMRRFPWIAVPSGARSAPGGSNG
jgi:hypothetical protein